MARIRHGTIYASVDAEVEIDVADIISDIETDVLVEELTRRKTSTPKGASGPEGGEPLALKLGSWDADSLREAVRQNDARRVIDLLKEAMQ